LLEALEAILFDLNKGLGVLALVLFYQATPLQFKRVLAAFHHFIYTLGQVSWVLVGVLGVSGEVVSVLAEVCWMQRTQRCLDHVVPGLLYVQKFEM
jgi:hypothetical protein